MCFCFKNYFYLFIRMCAFVSLCRPYAFWCLQRPQGVWSPGTGVTGSWDCRPLGTKPGSLATAASALNYSFIFPTHSVSVLGPEPRALGMLDKPSTTQLCPQACHVFFVVIAWLRFMKSISMVSLLLASNSEIHPPPLPECWNQGCVPWCLAQLDFISQAHCSSMGPENEF